MTDEKYLETTIKELISNPSTYAGKRVQVEGVARGVVPSKDKKRTLYVGFLQEEDNIVHFWIRQRYNSRCAPLECLLETSSQSGLAFTFKGEYNSDDQNNGAITVDSVGYQGYTCPREES